MEEREALARIAAAKAETGEEGEAPQEVGRVEEAISEARQRLATGDATFPLDSERLMEHLRDIGETHPHLVLVTIVVEVATQTMHMGWNTTRAQVPQLLRDAARHIEGAREIEQDDRQNEPDARKPA